MKQTIPENIRQEIWQQLAQANKSFQEIYPGERSERQPVHTVYGGANLFKHNLVEKMGEAALNSFHTYASNFVMLANVLELPGYQKLPVVGEADKFKEQLDGLPPHERQHHPAWLAYTVYEKVLQKLKSEPVEDFRIDFEDGFGNRPDHEEDEVAENAAREVAKGMEKGTLPPFIGIRIKPFTEDHKIRGLRTLDIFLSTLASITSGKLPDNFVVMLPKVTIPAQVDALIQLFQVLEQQNEFAAGSLKMEMMVETTQAVMDQHGKNCLMNLVRAGKGRLIACHFGTYDYTAACNITAKYQDMGHQVCDFAHHMTKVALGGTGIWLSDGATNIMPIAPHRGESLTEEQEQENTRVVHSAWKLGYHHTRHSLYKGLYQGWDLHPSQLPMRYTALYTFFLESYQEAALRLRKFIQASAHATLTGDIFDDAATGQGLLNYFIKAITCGALTEEEVQVSTGLSLEEIRLRSFARIIKAWQQRN